MPNEERMVSKRERETESWTQSEERGMMIILNGGRCCLWSSKYVYVCVIWCGHRRFLFSSFLSPTHIYSLLRRRESENSGEYRTRCCRAGWSFAGVGKLERRAGRRMGGRGNMRISPEMM